MSEGPISKVLSELGGVSRSGKGWKARCPAHEDARASLSVSEGADGRVLLKCHAGCHWKAVVFALGMSGKDLFVDDGRAVRPASEVQERYDYVDADGTIGYRVVRYKSKGFSQQTPDGAGGWKSGRNGTEDLLYRMPAVIKAVAAGERIYVCEGEKDVLAVEAAGGVGTTNSGGVGKWPSAQSHILAGADVTIVADKDAPGRTHARQVLKELDGVAASLEIVEAKEGKDVADHLAAGHALNRSRGPGSSRRNGPRGPQQRRGRADWCGFQS